MHSAAGTVFEGREPRLVEIDGFDMDVRPEGDVLVLFYPDRPGMVGRFGTILGDANINIARMDVGREAKHTAAPAWCSAWTTPYRKTSWEPSGECTGTGDAYLVHV